MLDFQLVTISIRKTVLGNGLSKRDCRSNATKANGAKYAIA